MRYPHEISFILSYNVIKCIAEKKCLYTAVRLVRMASEHVARTESPFAMGMS